MIKFAIVIVLTNFNIQTI